MSDLIDLVLGTYGSMSADELSALTHVEQPWLEARGDLPDGVPGNVVVSHDTMADFYRAHRKLGGRTAADLASSGVHPRAKAIRGPAPIDELLATLDDDLAEPGDDPWGGANLAASETSSK